MNRKIMNWTPKTEQEFLEVAEDFKNRYGFNIESVNATVLQKYIARVEVAKKHIKG